MKNLISLILILTLSSCGDKQISDLEKYNINGSVWKIEQINYKGQEKFGQIEKGEKNYEGHYLYIFNDLGLIVENHSIDYYGNSDKVLKYFYNDENINTHINTLKKNKIINKQVNLIRKNKIVKSELYDKEGKLDISYEFKIKNNKIIESKVFNENNVYIGSILNEYKNDKLVKIKHKDSVGEYWKLLDFIENSYGDTQKTTINYPLDSSSYSYNYKYEYDNYNNWIKQIEYDDKNKLQSVTIRNIFYNNVLVSNEQFIGLWFNLKNKEWFDLKKENNYDLGSDERIYKSGKWEINSKNKTITFKSLGDKKSEKYRFSFENNNLILSTVNGNEKYRLEKK
jgi:hypothetical protein